MVVLIEKNLGRFSMYIVLVHASTDNKEGMKMNMAITYRPIYAKPSTIVSVLLLTDLKISIQRLE